MEAMLVKAHRAIASVKKEEEEETPRAPWPPQEDGLDDGHGWDATGFDLEPTYEELRRARGGGGQGGGGKRSSGRRRAAPRQNGKPSTTAERAAAFGLRGGERLPEWGEGEQFRARTRRAVAERLSCLLADSTRRQYGVAERRFIFFCEQAGIDVRGFIEESRAAKHSDDATGIARARREGCDLVQGFIAWAGKARRHESGEALLSPGSVRNYGYGVLNFLAEMALLPDLSRESEIRRVLRRLAKEYSAEKSARPARRLALVPELGRQIVQYALNVGTELAIAYSDVYQATLFWGFRIMELLLTNDYNTFDPDRQLTNGGVALFQSFDEGKTEVPVRESELDDPELLARLTSVRVRTGHKTKTMTARERRHYKVSDKIFDLLCPVRTFHRVLLRAKKAGRGPRDMAFYVKGKGELRAGNAPSRSRGPAAHLGGVPLHEQYVLMPLDSKLKKNEMEARKRANEFRLAPLVGQRVRARFEASKAVGPEVRALEQKCFRDLENGEIYQVAQAYAQNGKAVLSYHKADGSGAFAEHASLYDDLMTWADWNVTPPPGAAAPGSDGTYGGKVSRIVHDVAEGKTFLHVDFDDGDGHDYTLKELDAIIEGGEHRGQRVSWGDGYRGYVFTALYLGPEGKGCYWSTEQGLQRVDPRRYSSHSGRIALTTVLFAETGEMFTAKGLGGWASWAVLNYQHDAADRYKGVSDIIVQSKVTAPMAESYDDYDP